MFPTEPKDIYTSNVNYYFIYHDKNRNIFFAFLMLYNIPNKRKRNRMIVLHNC